MFWAHILYINQTCIKDYLLQSHSNITDWPHAYSIYVTLYV